MADNDAPGSTTLIEPADQERTVEVLRAMLLAYEKAALDARVEFYSAVSDSPAERTAYEMTEYLEALVVPLRHDLAGALCGLGVISVHVPPLVDDFRARLRGDRPLDAPPAPGARVTTKDVPPLVKVVGKAVAVWVGNGFLPHRKALKVSADIRDAARILEDRFPELRDPPHEPVSSIAERFGYGR